MKDIFPRDSWADMVCFVLWVQSSELCADFKRLGSDGTRDALMAFANIIIS
jgi:hypothetical protein